MVACKVAMAFLSFFTQTQNMISSSTCHLEPLRRNMYCKKTISHLTLPSHSSCCPCTAFIYSVLLHLSIKDWISNCLCIPGGRHSRLLRKGVPSTSNLQKIGIMCKRKQKPQVRLWKGKRKSDSVIQHFGLPLCSLWWQIRLLCLILKLYMSSFK